MAHRTKEGTWRVQWRNEHGQRRSRTFPKKALADRFEAMLATGAIEEELGLGPEEEPIPPPLLPTFREFAERWMVDYCQLEKSATQWREDRGRIDKYLVPEFGATRLDELRRKDLEALKTRLAGGKGVSGKKLKAKSVNLIVATAKKILATAVDWDLIPASPFTAVKLLKLDEQPFDYWQAEERDRFIALAKAYDREFAELVLVAAFTGLRRGELAGLQRYQLDFQRRVIEVSATLDVATGRRHTRTKNRKVGYVPMTDEVYQALKSRRLAGAATPVFSLDLFKGASRRLATLCRKTGQREIRFHDLRHTFISTLVMAGVEIYTVQRLARHETMAMTQRYAHLAPNYLKSAIDVLSKRPVTGGSESDTDLARESVSGGEKRLQLAEKRT